MAASGLEKRMFVDTTQIFHYDTAQKVLKNSIVKISLSAESFYWNYKETEHSLPLSQIIGAQLVNPKIWTKGTGICRPGSNELELAASAITKTSTFWMIFAYDIKKNERGDIGKESFRRILFSSPDTATSSAIEIVDQINLGLGYFALDIREKKILFIANPFGGTSKAVSTYQKIVLPLLKLAGLENQHELIVTTHRNHAIEIGKSLNVNLYRSVTTISGDGVFHEFLNGILCRPDWKETCKLSLGIIGSGTSNALGQNLDLARQPLAVLAILKGRTQKMDVLSIVQNKTISYTHLMVAWTLIADVDIESEKFRKLGSLRMALMVLIRLINFRKYKGKLYLLPSDTDLQKYRLSNPNDSSNPGPVGCYVNATDESFKKWPMIIDSFFQYFIALNAPWIATDYLACPHTLIDNGDIDILYCEKISRRSVLASFLDAESGVSMTLPNMNYKRVKAFVLEPSIFAIRKGDKISSEDLIMDVSGERFPYSSIKVEVLPSLINIIVPSWLDSCRWQRNFKKELPVTLYRIQPKLPVGLRDFAIQQQLGRTSFDLKVHDGFVKPLSDSSKFTTPNGMSLRPVGENMLKILSAFKGEPLVYRLHEGLELPKGFIVYHEHTDHYSLQTSENISLEKLNSKLTDFLKSMPSQTKSQFFSQLEDEDDFDN